MDVSGKVFFITGGAQGLGKAYAETLLAKGAKIFLGDVDPKAGAETLEDFQKRFGEQNVKFTAFDVTDLGKFEAAFQEAVSAFGRVDVMVNNAGIMNEGVWQKMIQINYTALVWGTTLATEHMRKDKGGAGGRVINISSVVGLKDFPPAPVYTGTKQAVRAFTSSMASQPKVAELGVEYGILCPNAAATDMILKLDDSKAHFLEDFQDRIASNTMEIPTVVDAFMQLVQLENMNGAILWVTKEKTQFTKMKAEEVESPPS
ncbi:15-hydroxyprostaglandin dehydrogenase [NAD(+)] isoform X2 [Aplysia californica]|uniref:15-hydroxyprostaglandin dehydrogenase [NAD(+)] n=1 Tax=Aplysia californica TaxID=6500 RepID=A0ABM0JMX1_APLCA|nr:15-hydroxyprostaglandin dehydrogenase [NAD(+)] isoform X2 [Aplysia californica]